MIEIRYILEYSDDIVSHLEKRGWTRIITEERLKRKTLILDPRLKDIFDSPHNWREEVGLYRLSKITSFKVISSTSGLISVIVRIYCSI